MSHTKGPWFVKEVCSLEYQVQVRTETGYIFPVALVDGVLGKSDEGLFHELITADEAAANAKLIAAAPEMLEALIACDGIMASYIDGQMHPVALQKLLSLVQATLKKAGS